MPNKGTCKATECEKDVRAKGYCERHYAQWRRGKLPKPRYRECNTEGCHKPRVRRALCEEHFAKIYPGKAKSGELAGEPAASEAPSSAPEPAAAEAAEGGQPES